MKMIYDKKLDALLDPANMFIGDVDPLMNTSRQVAEIVSQNRPLYEFENEVVYREPVDRQEQLVVWICYITDTYGNPLPVKVVPTGEKALEWVGDEPKHLNKKDDETRGRRYAECFVVEAE